MHVENFYVLVGVILPKLDGVSTADMYVHATIRVVGFRIIGKGLGIIPDGDHAITQQPLIPSGSVSRNSMTS